MIYQYYKAGFVKGKMADTSEVISSFVCPNGFIAQFNEKDYEKYFGLEYTNVKKWSDSQLKKIYKNYGEMDAFIIIRLLKNNENVCNINANILHNTFSRRNWILPGKDLYKGNGKVKHEHHSIQQGPFQNIQIHSYQSSDKHDKNNDNEYDLGNNNHFDIYVFRNSNMFESREKSLQIYKLKDLVREEGVDSTKLITDHTKEFVVEEFVNFVSGKITDKKNIRSQIDDQDFPVNLMSAIYQSNINYTKKTNSWIKFPIKIKYE